MKITLTSKALCFIILFGCFYNSGYSQKAGWTSKNIYDKRYFIQNLGQFDIYKQHEDSKINYASFTKGVNIYFTDRGIVFSHSKQVKKSRKELKADHKRKEDERKKLGLPEEEDKENEHEKYKSVPFYQEIIWEGANADPKITVSDEIKGTYNFKSGKETIKAHAFQKMIYHDVYPNIDIEFYFPADSAGFKYNYRVRPGGNANSIKEKWLGNAKIKEQFNGDILVESAFGNVLAKKPISFLTNGKREINTSYLVSNNTVSYILSSDLNEDLVIDPWVVTPAFTSGTTAFDVDFDVAGNAYVYGGGSIEVLKYDAAGTFLWSYAPFSGALYGDFAVDQNSGSVYAVNGVGDPNVVKISSTGTFVADHFGSAAMNEMWRIAFSSCTNQAVIAGGGTGGTNAISYLDTNLTGMTTVNVLGAPGGCCYDMVLLTVDNYGFCYFLHADNTVYFSGYENDIVKSPMPTFLPLVYNVPSGHYFKEISGITYGFMNGFNGITIGDRTIYSYDSYVMKKWRSSDGAQLIYKRKNYPVGGDSLSKSWGGITADECKNVFIGSRDTVFQYDSMLVLQNFYPMPGTVIDLRISNDGVLYVTGDGFLQTLLPTGLIDCGSPVNPNLVVTDQTCYTLGSASVSPSGGQGPYSITWNTVPVQTGTSITDLPAGTYSVTISDASCNNNSATTTFTITTGPGGYSTGIVVQNISCNGLSDGSISLSPSGGIAPYSFAWDTLGLTGSSATGLGAGTYGILVTDSAGCLNNLTVTIIEPLPITATTNADTLLCFGDATNLVCFPANGTAPYSVLWNTPIPVTNDTLTGATAGIYSITITDSMGCMMTFTDTLYQPAPLTGTLVSTDVSCDSLTQGTITANINGGTGPYNYSWSNDPGDSTNIDLNLPVGIYTLTVNDNNNCTLILTDTINQLIFPTINFTSVQPCNGGVNGTITATPSGGTPGAVFTYSWNTVPVQTGLTVNNVGAGVYVLTVQSGACNFTHTFLLGEDPIIDTMAMSGVICGSNDFSTIYLPGGAQPTYQWYNLGVLIAGQTAAAYNVPVIDIPGISATWYTGGCRYITSSTVTTVYPVVSLSSIPNIFTPNNDTHNDLFYAFTMIGSTDPVIVGSLFEEFSVQIFDRWGLLMFETSDPLVGWNGKDKGNTPAVAGVYFVLIKCKALCSDTNDEIIYNGTVQLVR